MSDKGYRHLENELINKVDKGHKPKPVVLPKDSKPVQKQLKTAVEYY